MYISVNSESYGVGREEDVVSVCRGRESEQRGQIQSEDYQYMVTRQSNAKKQHISINQKENNVAIARHEEARNVTT